MDHCPERLPSLPGFFFALRYTAACCYFLSVTDTSRARFARPARPRGRVAAASVDQSAHRARTDAATTIEARIELAEREGRRPDLRLTISTISQTRYSVSRASLSRSTTARRVATA